MTSKRIAQTNQQQKSDTPKASGILQRAAVRSVSEPGVQSTDDQEALPLSNSAFSKDFSQVPISTTKSPQFHVRNLQSHPVPPIQAKLTIGEPGDRLIQAKGKNVGCCDVLSDEARPNKMGLPYRLKTGIEYISGYSMDDVMVEYNSPLPPQYDALAYTQGTQIHVAAGQEEHLPHEAWHVVQQMQGRVKPTMQLKGEQVNNEEEMEREADVMGARSVRVLGENERRGQYQYTHLSQGQITSPGKDRGEDGRAEGRAKKSKVYPGGYGRKVSAPGRQGQSKGGRLIQRQVQKAKAKRVDLKNMEYIKKTANEKTLDKTKQAGGHGRPLKEVLEIGKKLLQDLEGKAEQVGSRLRLYRGMKIGKAEEIIVWWNNNNVQNAKEIINSDKDIESKLSEIRNHVIPLDGHMGDYEAAQFYAKNEDEVILEITLKKGAESKMFDSEYMAVGKEDKLMKVTGAYTDTDGNKEYLRAGDDGQKSGYIGLKAEEKGVEYSIGVGSKNSLPSQLLFQMFIDGIRVVSKTDKNTVQIPGFVYRQVEKKNMKTNQLVRVQQNSIKEWGE